MPVEGQPLPATFFEEKIRPLLAEHCYACHTQSATGGLRLDSRMAMLRGGKTGPAIVPNQPNASLLLQAVSHANPKLQMPPGGKLTEAQIADLRKWIAAGADWPATAAPASTKPPLWAAKPLSPTRGSIDTHAKPTSPSLDKAALLRRLSFDLTGLPPSYDEMQAFVSDATPDAYERTVDRLLASPHFGERWARHWLDVARYAEDDVRGLGQATYPNAWRYRDWVASAYQGDLPYDEFVRLQIAADLLPRPGHDDRAALGLFGLADGITPMRRRPNPAPMSGMIASTS